MVYRDHDNAWKEIVIFRSHFTYTTSTSEMSTRCLSMLMIKNQLVGKLRLGSKYFILNQIMKLLEYLWERQCKLRNWDKTKITAFLRDAGCTHVMFDIFIWSYCVFSLKCYSSFWLSRPRLLRVVKSRTLCRRFP